MADELCVQDYKIPASAAVRRIGMTGSSLGMTVVDCSRFRLEGRNDRIVSG